MGLFFPTPDTHTLLMNIEIDEELPTPDDLEPVTDSAISTVDQSLVNARRKIERRRELRELREMLDDPLFDLDFD